MNYKFKTVIVLILTLIILVINSSFIYVQGQVDMFEKLLSNRNIEVSEYSVTATFNSDSQGMDACKEIVRKASATLGKMEYTVNDKDEFSNIIFSNEIYKGSITSTPYKDKNVVVITVIKKEKENRTKELKSKLSEILSHVNSRITYSQCIKGKILNNNLDEVNNFVMNELEQSKAKNINKAKLYNGYSIICNTNLYDSKKVGNMDVDFHCAVVKYSSGCYLVMGTPEITLDY
ncbi:hypothetical protein [Clostridium sp. UBA4548]|uniref:hypothetical protein n=1 Tax=Clostridium sp. UBA4548 TaxID=1946361 RepID=UPI0025C4815A|nr:hypothetical protein [Clostridium sp. UBA4548]